MPLVTATLAPPLEAEAQPERLKTLKALVAQCLPQVELAELITEVDQLTRFSESLVHTDGKPSRIENTEVYLYGLCPRLMQFSPTGLNCLP